MLHRADHIPATKHVALVTTSRVSEANPYAHNDLQILKRSIELNRPAFTMVVNPDHADYILVVGSGTRFYYDLITSALYKTHRRKLFVLDFSDRPIPVVPGLYMTLLGGENSRLFKQGFYLRVASNELLEVTTETLQKEPTYLGWFRGNVENHPVRSRLLELRADAAFCIEHRDTGWTRTESAYAEDLLSGKFILCPRGLGASTFRVFEAMRLGRVPVVISDAWVEPPGVHWKDFILRVAEADAIAIPRLLRAIEPDWQRMAQAAQSAWERNFSLTASIRWIDGIVSDLLEARASSLPDDFSFLRMTATAVRNGQLLQWLREWLRVKTGERTVFMAPQSEWLHAR
jgi:hypothetical protein